VSISRNFVRELIRGWAVRTTHASIGVSIAIIALAVVAALVGLPVGVVVAILALGAGRWAIVRGRGELTRADASADSYALDAARDEGSHADAHHGVAVHHGAGHGAGHGGAGHGH
jgi:hypothetical protein